MERRVPGPLPELLGRAVALLAASLLATSVLAGSLSVSPIRVEIVK